GPPAAPCEGSLAPDAEKAVADREARGLAAFTQGVVAHLRQPPRRIGGWGENGFGDPDSAHAQASIHRPLVRPSISTASRLDTTRQAPAARRGPASPDRATPSARALAARAALTPVGASSTTRQARGGVLSSAAARRTIQGSGFPGPSSQPF